MPIRRFRSVEEMPGPVVLPPLLADNLRRACELMELAAGLFPMSYEPGVTRFRSAKEASDHRELRELRQIRARWSIPQG